MDPYIEKLVGMELVAEGLSHIKAAIGDWRTEAAFEEINQLKLHFVVAASLIERGLAKMEATSGPYQPSTIQSKSTKSEKGRLEEGLVPKTPLGYRKQRKFFDALVQAGDVGISLRDAPSLVDSYRSHMSAFSIRAEQEGFLRREGEFGEGKRLYATEALIQLYRQNAITNQGSGSPPAPAS
jgi:hypothetical protein